MVANNWSKFRLLMWKNSMLQWRKPKQTFFVFAVPVFFTAILLLYSRTGESVVVDTATVYPPIPIGNLAALRSAMGDTVEFRLAYTPKSPHLEELLGAVAVAIGLNGIVGYATAAELEEQLIRRSLFVGVQFSTTDTYDTSLPQHLSYSLRFPGALRTTANPIISQHWHTDRTQPSGPISRLPRNRDDPDGGPPSGYHREGFLTVQNAIADQFLRAHSGHTARLPDSVQLQRYPHPPYTDNGILPELSTVYILFIMLAFVHPMTVLVETIATERERKLTESMRIMGLPGWMHWSGRFVQAAAQMVIIVSLMVLVLKLGSIFVVTPWTVLWLYLFVYSLSLVCFAMMMSTMFESAKVSVFVAEMVYIVLFLLFVVLPVEQMERYQLLLVTLLNNPGMGVGLQVLLQLEQLQKGAQWGELFATESGSSVRMNLGGSMLVMLAAAVIYILIGLYVEQVKPGASGVSRPWWFLCSSAFWTRSKQSDEMKLTHGIHSDTNNPHAEHFEATTSGSYAGIRMRGLRKIYNRTEALRPFDLDMYEDQITVLLGHNGAGKTTTMSILTGMIEPTAGTAHVNGFDIRTQMPSVRGSIGLCPQHNILFDELTVAEHIRFYCGLKGCDATATVHEVRKYVDLMQLQGKSDTRSAALSGGQKRMLSVCIAFCGGSKVIFCDEPSSGMDPAARRNLWRIFELEKAGRTVLLSTHFMDEADVLGDRIAIMNGGELKSVGTPFFLKKHFGLGYHLNCAVAKTTKRTALTGFLQQHIASIALEKDTGTELSYNLPDEHSDRFADMFRALEQAKETLDVQSYGVSLGTLEEVFLKVGSDAGDENCSRQSSNTVDVQHIQFQTSVALIRSQFHAMFHKKWLQFARNLPLSVGQIILPSVFVLLNAIIMLSYDTTTGNLPALAINLAMVPDPVVMLQTDPNFEEDTLPYRFFQAYEQLSTENGARTNRVPYLRDAIVDQWRLNYNDVVLHNHIGARMIGTNEVEAWFNNQPFHTAPLALAHMHNALLRVHLGAPFAISVTNAPLPFTAEARENPFAQLGQMWAFMLAYSMAFVMAMFAFAVVRERSNGADRLQFVSGAKVAVYWTSHFLFDYASFVVSVALLFACMVGFQEPGYTTPSDFGRIFLVLLLFGFAALHLTYLLARFFSVQAQAFTALAMGYAISGLVLTAVSMAMRLTNQTLAVDIVTYVGMLVSPHFALTTGLQNLHRQSQMRGMCVQLCDSMLLGQQCDANWLCGLFAECCARDVFEFSAHGLGAPLAYLAVVGVICAAVNLMIDYECFAWMARLCCAGNAHLAGAGGNNTELDGDVLLENQRVNAMGAHDRRSHALVVNNLTKNYGKLVAVNRLSLAVGEYECFGLLGVNGAGKTSTFGMLTGALPLSDGQAWIVGHNLRTDRQRANHVIGYTPQFDALIAEQTVRETLQMYCRLRGIPARHLGAVCERLAGELNFGQHLEKRVGECSGGNRRKLSTAVAMIGGPRLIFLDEPTTGMDPSARRSLWHAVDRTRKTGTAVVLTSHSMDECEVLCTRLAIMVNGQFECLGSVQHLKSKFSGGCTLVVKLRRPCGDETAEVARIGAFVASAFEGATLQKHFLGLLTYAIRGHGEVQWSSMFGQMKQAQSVYPIESFTLSQTTLEEVFLKLAEKQVHK